MAVIFGSICLVLVGAVVRGQTEALALVNPMDGSTVSLKVEAPLTHLVFFATWCPPCRDELGVLDDLDLRWEERGYRLVLIGVQTRHTAERLAAFAAEHDVPGRLLFDADGAVERAFATSGLPTHVLLDGQGREILRAEAVDEVAATIESRLGARKETDGR